MKLKRNHLFYRRAVISKYTLKFDKYDFSKFPSVNIIDNISAQEPFSELLLLNTPLDDKLYRLRYELRKK